MAGPSSSPIDVVSQLHEGFDRACEKAPADAIEIAGRRFSLAFAGTKIRDALWPSLRHLESPGRRDGGVTIRIWDSATSGVPGPTLPWTADDVSVRGAVRGFAGGDIRLRHDPVSGILATYDPAVREAIWWAPDARTVPWVERSSPLREILGWCLAGPRLPLVHTAAVGLNGAGALLAGQSGSGKSVTALAALAEGMSYAGDDHLFVGLDPAPIAHGLYGLARVHGADLELVPRLREGLVGWTDHRHSRKAVIDAHLVTPGRLVTSLELRALVFPRPAPGAATLLRPLGAAEAMRLIAPSTLYLIPQEPRALMAALAELVRRLPAYALDLGGNARQAARELRELCADG